jgi:hypothetical protein
MTPRAGQLAVRLSRHRGTWSVVLAISVVAVVACARICGRSRSPTTNALAGAQGGQRITPPG